MGRIELEIYTPGYVPNGREVAVIETARGTVRAELFGREVPVTVGNFIELAAKGFYDNLKFHACLLYTSDTCSGEKKRASLASRRACRSISGTTSPRNMLPFSKGFCPKAVSYTHLLLPF